MGNQPAISLKFDISTKYPMKYTVTPNKYDSPTNENNSRQPAQAGLLDLMQNGTYSQADLVNQTGKSRSTISRQIQQLEASGLIERMPDGRYRKKGEEEE